MSIPGLRRIPIQDSGARITEQACRCKDIRAGVTRTCRTCRTDTSMRRAEQERMTGCQCNGTGIWYSRGHRVRIQARGPPGLCDWPRVSCLSLGGTFTFSFHVYRFYVFLFTHSLSPFASSTLWPFSLLLSLSLLTFFSLPFIPFPWFIRSGFGSYVRIQV